MLSYLFFFLIIISEIIQFNIKVCFYTIAVFKENILQFFPKYIIL